MVRTLNDKHVNLYTTDPTLRDYHSGENGPHTNPDDFLFEVIKENYLTEYHQLTDEIGYGKLLLGQGYDHLSAFKKGLKHVEPVIETVISSLQSTTGIIVDIRDHTGGDDRVSKYIAGRFASSKKLFMTTRKRNGQAHDSFTEPLKWYVEPTGRVQYSQSVILLTSNHSIRAAETFTLAMRQNSNVTQVGDTTAGAFSDQVFFEMPNGWLFSVGVGDYRASDGLSYIQIRLQRMPSTGVGLKNIISRYKLLTKRIPEFKVINDIYIARIPLIQIP